MTDNPTENDLISRAEEALARALNSRARVIGGVGGQTIDAMLRSTIHSISAYDLDEIADALATLKASVRTRAAPKVKPLVWGVAERSGMTFQADCPSGRYYVADRGEYGWLWFRPGRPASDGLCADEAAAKAAAEADHKRRILDALE